MGMQILTAFIKQKPTERWYFTMQVDGKGILNQKTIETEVLAATTDTDWKKTAKIVVNRCYKEASGNL
jgi:hypothetical protein